MNRPSEHPTTDARVWSEQDLCFGTVISEPKDGIVTVRFDRGHTGKRITGQLEWLDPSREPTRG